MKKRLAISMFVILFVAAAMGGATMAWFTAEESTENVFTAGSLKFNLSEEMTSDSEVDDLVAPNVNPGDCYKKTLTITNEGTKTILLRMNLTEEDWQFDAEYLADNWEALGFDLDGADEGDLRAFGSEASYAEVSTILGDFEEDPLKRSDLEEELKAKGWIENTETGYWYYENAIEGVNESPEDLEFSFEICFDGEKMNNEYQKASFTVQINVEAIQASNNASGQSDWAVDSWYYDDGTAVEPGEDVDESGSNWAEWDPLGPGMQY